MGVTKKEYDAGAQESAKYIAWVKRFDPFFRALVWFIKRFGFIRRRVSSSSPGRIGNISRLAERGEHARAAELAIEALEEQRHRPEAFKSFSGLDYWWFFLLMATKNLEKTGDRKKQEEVIALAQSVAAPSRDYTGAACFLAFARWRFRTGDHQEAIAFAEVAARIDPTWAEPDFLLGWYRLVLGGDALTPFKSALRKDPKVLFRIASDPVCSQHPHIIASLKAYSKDSLITQGADIAPEFDAFQAGSKGSR